MKKVATIILNRNLPHETNSLYEHLKVFDEQETDIFIIEAGSDSDRLSKYYTWHVDDPSTRKIGLRYSRGMNYALLKLYENRDWFNYDYFFLLSNDTELRKTNTIRPLLDLMESHERLGILSPCSEIWGEKKLFLDKKILYFWYIHKNAFLIRRQFAESIIKKDHPTYLDFLFDGSNFYGFLVESELIAKAYANNWAAGITNIVYAEENESYLLEKSALIKTENYDKSLELYIKEGKKWLRNKYGFNSRWLMNEYVKSFYDKFFEYNPNLSQFKL